MWSIFFFLGSFTAAHIGVIRMPPFPAPPSWLKIHSTLQVRERRRERRLRLIGSAWRKKGKLSDVVWTKPWDVRTAASGGFQTLARGCVLPLLSEEQEAASCHFPSCHFQDQHLAPSFTSCCCVLPALQTDGTRASSVIFPTQPSVVLPLCLVLKKPAVRYLHRATVWPCCFRCLV